MLCAQLLAVCHVIHQIIVLTVCKLCLRQQQVDAHFAHRLVWNARLLQQHAKPVLLGIIYRQQVVYLAQQ